MAPPTDGSDRDGAGVRAPAAGGFRPSDARLRAAAIELQEAKLELERGSVSPEHISAIKMHAWFGRPLTEDVSVKRLRAPLSHREAALYSPDGADSPGTTRAPAARAVAPPSATQQFDELKQFVDNRRTEFEEARVVWDVERAQLRSDIAAARLLRLEWDQERSTLLGRLQQEQLQRVVLLAQV